MFHFKFSYRSPKLLNWQRIPVIVHKSWFTSMNNSEKRTGNMSARKPDWISYLRLVKNLLFTASQESSFHPILSKSLRLPAVPSCFVWCISVLWCHCGMQYLSAMFVLFPFQKLYTFSIWSKVKLLFSTEMYLLISVENYYIRSQMHCIYWDVFIQVSSRPVFVSYKFVQKAFGGKKW